MKWGCTLCGEVCANEGAAEKHFAERHKDEMVRLGMAGDLEDELWVDFHQSEGNYIGQEFAYGR